MIAIIYCKSGGGKTVNSSRVKGGTLLMDSDNSSIVLNNFDRPNITVHKIQSIADFISTFETKSNSGEFANIIIDNCTDLIDRWLLELGERGKNSGNPSMQDYQTVYNGIKRLIRSASIKNVNVIFNFWQDTYVVTQQDGTQISIVSPKMPQKILENICGLANIVAHVETVVKGEQTLWYYRLEGANNLYAKDQIFNRKSCVPENIFEKPAEKQQEKKAEEK